MHPVYGVCVNLVYGVCKGGVGCASGCVCVEVLQVCVCAHVCGTCVCLCRCASGVCVCVRMCQCIKRFRFCVGDLDVFWHQVLSIRR